MPRLRVIFHQDQLKIRIKIIRHGQNMEDTNFANYCIVNVSPIRRVLSKHWLNPFPDKQLYLLGIVPEQVSHFSSLSRFYL